MSATNNRSLVIIRRTRDKNVILKPLVAVSSIFISCLLVLLVSLLQAPASDALNLSNRADQQQKQHNDKEANINSSNNNNNNRKNSLEAELESIVQQHDSLDLSDRSLAEAIISRLMVDDSINELTMAPTMESEAIYDEPSDAEQQQLTYLSRSNPVEALKLKKLLSMAQWLQAGGAQAGGSASALPMLPAGQAATSKRASKMAGNYLQQRPSIANGVGNSPSNGYGRSSFDFGLGKRPDTTGASSNILRYGDSLSGGGGSGLQSASQFGKRPSAHRYDFGLGKRVASSAYPRYDFGLGKRAPNRIRYDFGLGK